MAIQSTPIYAKDIYATTKPDAPVSLELKPSVKLDQPLARGWLAGESVKAGFGTFAARYNCYETYDVVTRAMPGLMFVFNLGDVQVANLSKQELHLRHGHFATVSLDEPAPTKLHREASTLQERCGIWLDANCLNSGLVEQFDDGGTIKKMMVRRGMSEGRPGSKSLHLAASRLFEAFTFDGPLGGLRREAASLSFFAEAVTDAADAQFRNYSRVDAGRMARVKDMLDNLQPDAEIGLVSLAVEHGMSVRSLCRHFRLSFGSTVANYVAGQRMERARAALERDEISIDRAAYLAGFAHTPNFSLAFRRRYGFPPSGIRGRGAGIKNRD